MGQKGVNRTVVEANLLKQVLGSAKGSAGRRAVVWMSPGCRPVPGDRVRVPGAIATRGKMGSARHSLTRLAAVVGCLLFFLMLVTADAHAGDYKLPDTGQHKCYDNAGNEITCPQSGERFYGQDAQYQGPEPAFHDNGDGTVTDLNTGLMWQQGDDQNECVYGVDCYTWQEAVDYCQSLNLAGYTDWRLPSKKELASLVNYGRYDPAIDTTYFPHCRSAYYWLGSTCAFNHSSAWAGHFSAGFIGWGLKASHNYVRCVRAGP